MPFADVISVTSLLNLKLHECLEVLYAKVKHVNEEICIFPNFDNK